METTAPLTYIPDAIQAHEELFSILLESLPWHRRTLKMYGKVCAVPRDEVWIGPYPYTYSGRTYPAAPWPSELLPVKAVAEHLAGVRYDSVLLNLYRTGVDKVAWHCDCEKEMSGSHAICSISLGATRKFQIRRRHPKDSPIQSCDLESGSVLLMHPGMQQEWFHQVPARPRVTKPRINLTFRVMVENQ